MKPSRLLISALLALPLSALLTACAAAPTDGEQQVTQTDSPVVPAPEQAVAPPIVAVIPATAEMIAAARAGQPLPQSALGSCHGNVVCPPEYNQCISYWSSAGTCYSSVSACGCKRCFGNDCVTLNGNSTYTEAYNVCFNQYGQSCTQYQDSYSYTCSGGDCP